MEEVFRLIFHALIFPGGLFAMIFGLFLMGLDRKLYARLQRRVGPPLHQPFIDVVKLMQKEVLIPRTANQRAFQLAPLIGFAGIMMAVVLIPIAGVYPGLAQSADLLVLLYLLITPALALIIGGSSSSSPFSAVGISREMMLTLFYEIPLLIVLLTVAIKAGHFYTEAATFSLSKITGFQQQTGPLLLDITMLPAFLAFLCCIPGSIGTVPFDIPEAETEIVEGPILEYSGSGLILFKIMGGIKMMVLAALGVTLFFPGSGDGFWLISLAWFLVKCVVLVTVSVTIVRASTGRMRIDQAAKFYLKVPTGLAVVSLLATLYAINGM
ncbi:NADH-quinone oxidoreductase subunit H [Sporomusa carbonis]|uniref:respiratory chain complex I subunit 1 family protein n=1 Tax=Sporomusa carbonis TaxID=3076075 RepID=UPI003A718B9D